MARMIMNSEWYKNLLRLQLFFENQTQFLPTYEVFCSVPDLPLCLGVLKNMTPLNIFFAMDIYLFGAILNLKPFLNFLSMYAWLPVKAYWVYILQGPSKGPHNLTSTWPHFPKSGTDFTTYKTKITVCSDCTRK